MTEQSFSPSQGNQQSQSPAPSRKPWRFVWAAALLLLLLPVAGFFWYWSYPDKVGPPRVGTVTVDIPQGAGVSAISRILANAGIVEDDIRFVLLAKVTGASRQLKAGEYAFAPRLTPRQVIAVLSAGKVVQHAITLPEGLTVEQVAAIVSESGWGGREDFIRLAADPEILRKVGVTQGSAEGYLFPDTYFFAKGTSLRAIITAMLRRMDQVLVDVGVERGMTLVGVPSSFSTPNETDGEGKMTLSLSRHQVLTLASIIEKETALPDERPLVARVFLNRLRLGMKLQADPTVIYGLSKFGSPLTKNDLQTPNPYNTYVNRGLPIGPICNPGQTAIAAVVRPSVEDYYYFVAQGDGTHYFSKSLAEHNRAVFRYRKKRLSNRE